MNSLDIFSDLWYFFLSVIFTLLGDSSLEKRKKGCLILALVVTVLVPLVVYVSVRFYLQGETEIYFTYYRSRFQPVYPTTYTYPQWKGSFEKKRYTFYISPTRHPSMRPPMWRWPKSWVRYPISAFWWIVGIPRRLQRSQDYRVYDSFSDKVREKRRKVDSADFITAKVRVDFWGNIHVKIRLAGEKP